MKTVIQGVFYKDLIQFQIQLIVYRATNYITTY